MPKVDYRKLYEKEFGIIIPKDFEIHHLDRNRKNNQINNLLLLPVKLHHQYHVYIDIIENVFKGFLPIDEILSQTITCNSIVNFAKIIPELKYWVACKTMELISRGGYGDLSYNEFRK